MKFQPYKDGMFWQYDKYCSGTSDPREINTEPIFIKCPYGKKGDILWVRETWRGIEQETGGFRYEYKATEKINLIDKWKPSIFMPKEAARIFLKVTDVRVERLQDISEADAIAEGIVMNNTPHEGWYWMENVYSTDSALIAYEKLWNKINGKKYPWDSNPWVWVISFEKTTKP